MSARKPRLTWDGIGPSAQLLKIGNSFPSHAFSLDLSEDHLDGEMIGYVWEVQAMGHVITRGWISSSVEDAKLAAEDAALALLKKAAAELEPTP